MHKSLACVLYFSVERMRIILSYNNFFTFFYTCHYVNLLFLNVLSYLQIIS